MTAMALTLVFTYLVAAIPFGLVITTLYGGDVDVRAAGSGNIGATNVARVYGWRLAGPVLLLDALKGFSPVLFAVLAWPDAHVAWPQVVGLVAFVGHCWPVYLEFKGGKGVATAAGALLALTPASTGLAVAVWTAVFLVGRRSSIAALAASLAVVGFTAWLRPDLLIAVIVVAALVVWRHVANIRRIVDGEEAALVEPVRWGRRHATPTPVENLLQQGPGGLGTGPAVWREEADPLAGEE
jgi:glycerol-3-phosphate acyltransferase PlsY